MNILYIILALSIITILVLVNLLWQEKNQISHLKLKKYTEDEFKDALNKEKVIIKQNLEEDNQILKATLREEAKEKAELEAEKLKYKIKEELRLEEQELRQRILDLQESLDKKEDILELKLEKVQEEKGKIEQTKEELRNIKQELLGKKEELEKQRLSLEEQITLKLEEIAKLGKEEAKKQILYQAEEEMGNELISFQHKIVQNAEEDANVKAREIVSMAIQRCSSEVANELTITTVHLESDEDKGKIIGKQGRNIQWLEKTLGVELVIDETPGVVTISGFSSIRRHIAKKTLEKLIADGRIHPSSIEEMYEKAKSEIALEIAEAGEETVNELGIYDFPAKLIRLIGRLKFRTSYGQNMMKHSKEMARLAGLLADEVNASFPNRQTPVDKMICIKGALLHDIGKAIDEESTPKGNHIELGEKICDMFGLDWRIKKCVSSHHNEEYWDKEKGFCVEAVLVDACDNISGGRLGARKETAEAYFQRLEGLEKIVKAVKGVTQSWVMRGGKEMWVFFDTQTISPSQMHRKIRTISKSITDSVKTPVKIKVIGFYEDRAVEYAG